MISLSHRSSLILSLYNLDDCLCHPSLEDFLVQHALAIKKRIVSLLSCAPPLVEQRLAARRRTHVSDAHVVLGWGGGCGRLAGRREGYSFGHDLGTRCCMVSVNDGRNARTALPVCQAFSAFRQRLYRLRPSRRIAFGRLSKVCTWNEPSK